MSRDVTIVKLGECMTGKGINKKNLIHLVIDPAELKSEVNREKIVEYIYSTLATRIMP